MKHEQRRPLWAAAILTALLSSVCAASVNAQCTQTISAQKSLLEGSSPGSTDYLGYAVDVSGQWAVAGAYADGSDVGSAEVYRLENGTWVQFTKLVASNAQSGDRFGISVAVDGNTIVVGAYFEDPTGASDAGSAYVFELQSGAWVETAILTAPTPAAGDNFGFDVDVSGDTVLIGARFMNRLATSNVGSAFVFTKLGRVWTLEQQLDPSVLQVNLEAGWSVAVEGNVAVLGAPGHHVQNIVDQGSAFVFERAGTVWTETANVSLSSGASGDAFGDEVAVGGGRIAVGAHLADGAAGANQGEVTVFSKQFSLWSFEQLIQPASAAAADEFGTGVAIDGQTLLVGAWGVNALGSNSGAAYVFTSQGGGSPWTWSERTRVLPWKPQVGDNFGFAVGLSGSTAICGALGFNGTGTDVGASYIHELSPGCFTLYGFGDASATPCPCSNDSWPGLGQGCKNSTGQGGRLSAMGSDSAAASNLTFVAGNLLPSNPALLFAGKNAVALGAGVVFGDGLRVAGGSIKRLGAVIPTTNGDATWGPFTPAVGGWSAGQTRYFQAWYRDPVNGPCSSGFNLSNGLQVDFN